MCIRDSTYTEPVVSMFRKPLFTMKFSASMMPILIAYSAAKVFGGNPYLGAVIGIDVYKRQVLSSTSTSPLSSSVRAPSTM